MPQLFLSTSRTHCLGWNTTVSQSSMHFFNVTHKKGRGSVKKASPFFPFDAGWEERACMFLWYKLCDAVVIIFFFANSNA